MYYIYIYIYISTTIYVYTYIYIYMSSLVTRTGEDLERREADHRGRDGELGGADDLRVA